MRPALHAFWVSVLFVSPSLAQDATSPAGDAVNEQLMGGEASLDLIPAPRYKFHSLSIRWDNDGAYAKPIGNHDKHYTNGIEFDAAWTPLDDHYAPDWWLEGDWERWAVGMTFVQHIYTGEDITDPDPPDTDRPYAGYAALGGYMQRASSTTHDHLQLELGLVGEWSGAERTQKWVHKTFPTQDDPQGWDDQIRNEPTVNLSFARTWKSKKPEIDWAQFEFLPSVSADLGNAFTRAAVDLTFRIGPSLPDDFGPGRIVGRRDATGTGWDSTTLGWNWYVYARLGMRAVAHDITLDGNTWKSSRSVDREPFVGEMELGVRARRGCVEIGYQINTLTDEFTTQGGPDSYGEISLTIYF